MYKIVHGLVAILQTQLVRPHRISRNSHPFAFRQIQTTKNIYKYSHNSPMEHAAKQCCLTSKRWPVQTGSEQPDSPQTLIKNFYILFANTVL